MESIESYPENSSRSSSIYDMPDITMPIALTQKNSNSSLESHNDKQRHLLGASVDSELMHSEMPQNFGEVVKGVYRCAFPHPWNLPSLQKLGLRTILTLVDEPYTPSHMNFLKENGIMNFRIEIQANKDPTIKTPDHVISRVLEIILNKANHPILIHCNKGKHRTGCVVGCFRKLQDWDMRDIIREYLDYSWPKSRVLDERFIEAFDASKLAHVARISGVKSWQPTKALEPKDGEIKVPKSLTVAPKGLRMS